MNKEQFDRYLSHRLQGIDPITGEYQPSAEEIAEWKKRKEKRESRVFWVLGVPVGFVVAMVIGLNSNLGNTGFFCAWAVCSVVSGAVLNSIFDSNKSSE